MKKDNPVVDLIISVIQRELSPQRIILFGLQSKDLAKRDSDLDVAVIQKQKAALGQKARVFTALARSNYGWEPELDLHIFSENEFAERLESGDLFVREVQKGQTLYQAGT